MKIDTTDKQVEILNKIIEAFYNEEWPEYFQEAVSDIFKEEGITETYRATNEAVRCEDCKYYDDMEDNEKPEYRECHYFSNWFTAHYMLPNDSCTCGKKKGD